MLQKTSIFSDFLSTNWNKSTNSFYKTQVVFSWIQPRGVLRNPTLKGSKPSLPVECRTRTVSKSSMQQSLHQSKQPNHHQSKPKQASVNQSTKSSTKPPCPLLKPRAEMYPPSKGRKNPPNKGWKYPPKGKCRSIVLKNKYQASIIVQSSMYSKSSKTSAI